MRFDVLTLFPEMFPGYLGQSLLHKAIQRGLVEIHLHNIRDWTNDKHHSVDDRPFGGGPGMVMMAPPVVECAEAVERKDERPSHRILLTPQGRTLTQRVAEELFNHQRIMLLCGRYEGFDQRVIDILKPEELSVGDHPPGKQELPQERRWVVAAAGHDSTFLERDRPADLFPFQLQDPCFLVGAGPLE